MSDVGNGAAAPGPGGDDPLVGTKVGNFRLTAKVGAGGMGVVYAAEHELMGKKAAVKLLLPELSTNKEIVGRFFNEARAATKINHAGIVDIYDFGYHETGHAYIVMEFLAGESLSSLMKKGLHFGRVVDIAWQLGSALGAAHKRGIVHRDVKPDNIFVVPDPATPTGDRVKVLDFGIAKLTGEDMGGSSLKTRTGAVMGTPIYMSPEQCKGSGEVDSRSDIYAMGVIMFEMACGQPPFVRSGFGELITAHIVEAPPQLSALNPSVPAVYEAIVLRMLAKEPEDRYQTAEEVVGDLSTISSEAVASVTRIPATVKAGGTGRSKLRRRRLAGSNRPEQSGIELLPEDEQEATGNGGRKKILIGLAAAVVVVVVAAAALTGGTKTPEVTPQPSNVASAPAPVAAPAAPASVKIGVTSTPAGAQVFRADDGAFLGRTPYAASFPRSGHELTVVVRQDGYVEQRVVLPLLDDGKADVTLKAAPAAAAAPAPIDVSKAQHPTHASKSAGDAKSKAAAPASTSGDGKGGKKKRNWGDLVDF